MKKLLTLLSVFILMSISTTFAQEDTVYIPWQDGSGNFLVDSMVDGIVGDTSATGEQLHKYYKLERGGSYIISRTIAINDDIVIFSDPADRDDPTKAPPVIRIQTNEDGTPSAGLFFAVNANLEVRNLYFAGMGTGSVWMDGNWCNVGAPDITIAQYGCYFDYMGWSIITNWDHAGCTYIIQDSYIKNNQNPGDPNSPFWYLGLPPVKKIVAKNTTYFQSHGYFIQPVGAPIEDLEIDHCSFVNNLEMNLLQSRLTNVKITNNIYYNTQAAGQSAAENADKDADGLPWSIINVDTLAGNEAGASDSLKAITMAEADRKYEVHNNAWFRVPELETYYGDTLITGPFMNERTQAIFDNDTDWPGMNASNNVNEAPTFGNIDGANDLMLGYVRAYRGIEGTQDFWGFESDQVEWPTLFRVNVEWPFSEDLSHTGLSIVGTDGEPLGDLTWFGKYVTSVEEVNDAPLPTKFELEQNYPNPFNPSTTINFSLPEKGMVALNVYNLLGQKIAELVNEELSAGTYNYNFDASELASGIYVYMLQTNDIIQSKKMMLLK